MGVPRLRTTIPFNLNSARSRRLQELEEIRNQLPISLYLSILHTAAITGSIPEYDYNPYSGQPPKIREGQATILDVNDRLKVLSYLVDKALAPLSPSKSAEPEAVPTIEALPPDTRNLTLNQLVAMIKATSKDSTPAQNPQEGTDSE